MKKKHAQNITENSGVQYEQNNNAAKELTNTSDETINEDKNKTMDCREHCMHCGMHCIYLNKNDEEDLV